MRRLVLLPCVLALAVTGWVTVPASADEAEPSPTSKATTATEEPREIGGYLLDVIARHQRETWRWQRLMGKPRTRTSHSALRSNDADYRRWVAQLWERRALRARRQAANPPHLRQWLCIRRYEGRWNDPNPPYFGGLQMDLTFQRQYGASLLRRKGTADNWTPLEQMWVAERAHRSGRGFTPWPNTARFCGLL